MTQLVFRNHVALFTWLNALLFNLLCTTLYTSSILPSALQFNSNLLYCLIVTLFFTWITMVGLTFKKGFGLGLSVLLGGLCLIPLTFFVSIMYGWSQM